MTAIEDRHADSVASEGVLPDAPVGLVRLDAAARVVAANREAWDLLAVSPDAVLGQPCESLWGLPAAVLDDEEGSWCAPGNDPARRIRYQADRDGEGWLLSLPHPETGALMHWHCPTHFDLLDGLPQYRTLQVPLAQRGLDRP